MKFVKDHLFLIICGVVALLALGALYWPISSESADLVEKGKQRYRQVSAVNEIMNFPINIPGVEPMKGPPVPKITKERQAAMADMQRQATEIANMFAQGNRGGRVLVQNDRVIPLLGGKEMDGYLPTISRSVDAYDFKQEYEKYILQLVLNLTGVQPANNTMPAMAQAATLGTPPSADEITRVTEEEKRKYALRPEAKEYNDKTLPPAEIERIVKSMISQRAIGAKMYATPQNLQRRGWYNGTEKPNETQMFEALMDCWLMTDVVNAINAVNTQAFASRPNKTAGEKHGVAHSAIKKLDRIIVGGSGAAAAAMDSQAGGAGPVGGLFLGAGNAAAGKAGGIDPNRSMTGRLGEDKYDVVLVRIQMVIEPSAINKFIAQLYKQNNGYTVLNVNMATIDPYEAVSNGFLYGENQCVRVDMLVESLVFREWATPLMPQSYRQSLGLPPLPPKP